jgi:hypothetical protein
MKFSELKIGDMFYIGECLYCKISKNTGQLIMNQQDIDIPPYKYEFDSNVKVLKFS